VITLAGLQISPKGTSKMATLGKVSLDIQVVLGTTTMPVHQVLRLGRGAIIELDSSEDDEVEILAKFVEDPPRDPPRVPSRRLRRGAVATCP